MKLIIGIAKIVSSLLVFAGSIVLFLYVLLQFLGAKIMDINIALVAAVCCVIGSGGVYFFSSRNERLYCLLVLFLPVIFFVVLAISISLMELLPGSDAKNPLVVLLGACVSIPIVYSLWLMLKKTRN